MSIIKNEEGYLFYDNLDGSISDCILIEQDRLINCVEYVIRNRIKKISINPLYYDQDSLEFLSDINHVEEISILSDKIKSLAILKDMVNLKYISIDGPMIDFNLCNLVNLEELRCGWSKKSDPFISSSTSIKSLLLNGYRPLSKNLSNLSDLIHLKNLEIVKSNIESLNGLQAFCDLKTLDLAYISKLKDIFQVTHLKNRLENLHLESCKNILNYSCLGEMNHLREISFTNCGDIDSLDFVSKLENLKTLTFVGTTIVDGNLSPLVGLERVGFYDKKHYTHKSKDFNVFLK